MGLRRVYRKYVVKTARTLTYHGLVVPLRRSGMTQSVAEHLYCDLYEVPEINGLQAVVAEGDTVLELGAGLGIITALAARKAGRGRVISYEANPAIIDDTRAFLASNGIASVDLRAGVLVREDVPAGATRTFYLAPSFAEGSLKHGAGQAVEVPATTLARVMAEVRPDVLICDIEGAEADLLTGLDASGLRAAVIELHPHILTRSDVAAIYETMARHRLFPAIEHSGGTVVVFSRVSR